ncbi:hypothetical protein FHR70_000155 [Microvirga lupini]|uniref:Uncharacterized protein n=1 Tax=Microvirga lupini TaxID=420324 RepID=A0A7W4VI23_9HYPH|nr:hypothetical protein [Microvirga lupini]
MSRYNTDKVDHPLDAEDLSCHCPRWLLLILTGLGALGLIGHQLSG